MSQSYEIDMCHGPLFGKIIRFSIPLMLSGILQLLFNAADIIVVGRFVGSTALAAVGSTSSLINLLINLFIGVSVGANVLVARFHGAGRDDEVNETVHTAITLSMVSGIFLLILGVTVTRTLLIWMGSPDDVLDQSSLYLKIYFLAMPATLLYNFGSSILRAVGDTKRPLFYLVTAGIINVFFNLFFVIVCHLGVAGVGLATVIAEYISAALIIRCLMRSQGCCHLDLHQLGIVKGKLRQIMQIGLPAGMQGVVFSLSNVLIQSSINSFGSTAMAGNTASMNIENFIYISMNTFQQTAMSFTSQNYGAGEEKRIHKVLFICQGLVISVGLIFGVGAWLAGDTLLSIYLFIGSQCDSVWKGPNGCNLYGLLFMRHYGYNGGCTSRCRLFADANDCFSDRCLRPADCVDFYCVSDSQKSMDVVYFLSNYLDYYRWCSYSLLYSCQKKAITDGKESVKIQK